MSREWCIVARLAERATSDERELIETALRMRKPEFDFELDEGNLLVYVDAPHNPKRVEKAVMHTLAESGVAQAVVTPLRLGRWDERAERYDDALGFVLSDPEYEDAEPAVSPEEIRWLVEVRPASAFKWKAMREELRQRGRTTIGETDHALCVGARDEEDAEALVAELEAVEVVGRAEARPLSWFGRWRVREQLLGNYSEQGDPTQPF